MTVHRIVLVGDADTATELLAAGVNDFVIFDRDVVSAVFDDSTDTWTLSAEDGETRRAQVVISCDSPFVPRVAEVLGRRDFRGPAMHAAMPAGYFDPAGQRVAVLGGDSGAGALIEHMTELGATVEIFPLAPRRHVARRALRLPGRRRVRVIASPVEELTPVGVRTVDGVHHDADAVVYGTGFAVRAGLPSDTLVGAHGQSIQQAWVDGAEPYLGVALHGFPNYFTVGGPDFAASMRYVVQCLQLLGRHTRIEVRLSALRVFNERVHLRAAPLRLDRSAFDVSSCSDAADDSYRGPATVSAADSTEQVRVALAGRIEPIDGQYHWQGTIFDSIPPEIARARTVRLSVGALSAEGRVTERTQQGGHSIAGTGAPPFPLELT